jgi:hypothetical protein
MRWVIVGSAKTCHSNAPYHNNNYHEAYFAFAIYMALQSGQTNNTKRL